MVLYGDLCCGVVGDYRFKVCFCKLLSVVMFCWVRFSRLLRVVWLKVVFLVVFCILMKWLLLVMIMFMLVL